MAFTPSQKKKVDMKSEQSPNLLASISGTWKTNKTMNATRVGLIKDLPSRQLTALQLTSNQFDRRSQREIARFHTPMH